ncbi:hypothetical protein K402DRAFT_343049 [Aulographum hederae CBS 113979]|uniref:RING-type domain-containing protein n=1 Tax=Aulographum hederae CBS 113979 TaxID=1176131 RepID=A0A6G1GK51_9PEZI|nr:hypothetical protein K402DRAFT_343049 [Aulographum hederae CBS 113979]
MAGGAGVNLENELSCSICTDILYQPLTLLDCLHTFCGACVKEWFGLQASRATNTHPYTCPQCRATVRGTKPDARVTTLLEMFLQANPTRGKSDEEKEDARKQYNTGDNVLPRIRLRGEDSDDRRIMDEVRALSLQEVGVGGNGRLETRARRSRESSRDGRHRRPSQNGQRSRGTSPTRANARAAGSRGASVPPPSRQVEHQSSLRSLIGGSDSDSRDIEEEIMRQILEEGLLDGLDLENIDVSQEDEISERIAEAYRRRRERDTARSTGTEMQPRIVGSSQRAREDSDDRRRRQPPRQDPTATSSTGPSRPPVSRPHLFESIHPDPGRQGRSSSQGTDGRPSRAELRNSLTSTSSRPGAQSATDLTETTASSRAIISERRRISRQERSITDPEMAQTLAEQAHQNVQTRAGASNHASRAGSFPQESSRPSGLAMSSAVGARSSRRTGSASSERPPRPSNSSNHSLVTLPDPGPSGSRPSNSSTPAAPVRPPPLFSEPSINCSRCEKQHIEYEVHYNCQRCNDGAYNICLSCYRSGKGCLHWFGFGNLAWIVYERKAPPEGYPPNYETPHILTGHRYLPPTEPLSQATDNETVRSLSAEDPAKRLESGVFCDICQNFANSCYWKCDACNDGAWGFCNDCVNQGRHCTHPLLPLAHKSAETTQVPRHHRRDLSAQEHNGSDLTPPTAHTSTPPLTPKSASMIRGPAPIIVANTTFRALTFSAACDICTYPIPPSHTRFHCPRCNNGDYDICTSCYYRLVSDGRIGYENGYKGWRRCLQGHRMVVVGFEDRDGGQRRVVTQDLVGGLALKDEDGVDLQAARFPPDGGEGDRLVMIWSYYPTDGVTDELMFPRGAEIREAYNINGDWFWGCYAGAKGLFPGNYGRVL